MFLASSILIKMHSDENPSRSMEDLSPGYAAWVDNAAAFKRRGGPLRKVAKSLSIVSKDAASAN